MLKRFLIVATVLACAFAVSEDDVEAGKDVNQRRPPLNGQQLEVSVESHDSVSKEPSENCTKFSESQIQYILYTREIPEGEVVTANPYNLSRSSLNVKKPLKVIVHSWLQDKTWTKPVARDYLYSQNVDVLVVDWKAYSEKCSMESTSIMVTPFVAESLSRLLRQIISIGHKSENMHLIGFSHGAHIVGIAGRYMSPHLPARITALDPLRLEEIDQPGPNKLHAGDAKFVDVIVTSLPALSFYEELGQVIFYPNGGLTKYQGHCAEKTNEMDKMICGHALAYKFFAESLTSPKKFPGYKCESYSKFLARQCDGEPVAHMGEYVEKNVRGNFYLNTNKNFPYDKGLESWKQTSA